MDKIPRGENQNIASLNDYMMVSVTLSDVSSPHETIFNYDKE